MGSEALRDQGAVSGGHPQAWGLGEPVPAESGPRWPRAVPPQGFGAGTWRVRVLVHNPQV